MSRSFRIFRNQLFMYDLYLKLIQNALLWLGMHLYSPHKNTVHGSHGFLTIVACGFFNEIPRPDVGFWEHKFIQITQDTFCINNGEACTTVRHTSQFKPQTQWQKWNWGWPLSYSSDDCVVKLHVFSQQAAASCLLSNRHSTSPCHSPALTQSETVYTALIACSSKRPCKKKKVQIQCCLKS